MFRVPKARGNGDGTAMPHNLRRLRIERGWTYEQAATQMGLSRSGYEKIERGERQLTEATLARATQVFGVTPSEIMSSGEIRQPANGNAKPPIGRYQRTAHKLRNVFTEARDVPVYASVEGGPGMIVVSTDPIEFVPRPWFLGEVKDGYAVVVMGESMVPAYEPGDYVIVNPRLAPIRGKDAIFVCEETEGEFIATLKRLERSTATDWVVHQWNPPLGQKNQLLLPKVKWQKAYRVVGKYTGT